MLIIHKIHRTSLNIKLPILNITIRTLILLIQNLLRGLRKMLLQKHPPFTPSLSLIQPQQFLPLLQILKNPSNLRPLHIPFPLPRLHLLLPKRFFPLKLNPIRATNRKRPLLLQRRGVKLHLANHVFNNSIKLAPQPTNLKIPYTKWQVKPLMNT